MGDALIGLGVLLAIFGPLLMLALIWLVYRFGTLKLVRARSGTQSPGRIKRNALGLSAILVTGVVATSYIPGRLEYDRLCARHAVPIVSDRTNADGFFRTSMFPYEALRYLRQSSFDFVEAPDPYREGVDIRYTLGEDGELAQEEVSALRSRYSVSHEFVRHRLGTFMTEKVVHEIETGRELARAASLIYSGGPLALLLGSYGTSSCPDVRSRQGSEDFATFYDLETLVLRANSVGP